MAKAKPKGKRTPKTVAKRPDLEVVHDGNTIVKTASTDETKRFLLNEARFLEALAGTGIAPELLSIRKTGTKLVCENLGEGGEVTDDQEFLRGALRLLCELRRRGIRHGDLTSRNIIVRDNVPMAIDFQQATMADEDKPSKRPEPDGYHFWRAIDSLAGERIRSVKRWQVVRHALGGDSDDWDFLAGKNVVDLGCWEGETTAMAVAEGAEAVGIDHRPEAIDQAIRLWGEYGCQFHHGDVTEGVAGEITLFFSTWPYIVMEKGRNAAEEALDWIIHNSDVLFFETQLWGDGPGPAFFQNHDDVKSLLERFGYAQFLADLLVHGRGASRSLWKVTNK